MGQYYMPYIKEMATGKEMSLYSHQFGSGLKLTEHSWIGNHFCNRVLNLIIDKPMKIAWVGDYAEYEDIENNEAIGESEFNQIYNKVWEDEQWGKEHRIKPDEEGIKFDFSKNWYFVNKTKKEYFNLKSYIENSRTEDDWCLQPLSLLTAVGNGKGGGDYRGCNQEYIGYWAFDEIYISEKEPQGYLLVEDIVFNENW